MKRTHYAILSGEILSYALIITFIFAETKFNLTGVFREGSARLDPQTAFIGACLIGLVGTINVWLTWYYMCKSATVRDWLVICAWTRRVRSEGRWISMEDFLINRLGYNVTHGMSEEKFLEMRDEIDTQWRRIDAEVSQSKSPGKLEKSGGAASNKDSRLQPPTETSSASA
jgi:hypothetical protein